MKYSMRPANNEDRAAIERLVFGVLTEYGLAPDPQGIDADLHDIQREYFSKGGSFDVLVDEEGRIVGSVGLYAASPDICELRKMYLATHVRGRGLGHELLNHALTQAKALGFSRIELETASVLKEAIALYQRCGFFQFHSSHLSSRCDSAYYLCI